MSFTKFIEPILLEPGVIDSFMRIPNAKDAIDALYFSINKVGLEQFQYFWQNFDLDKFCNFIADKSKNYTEPRATATYNVRYDAYPWIYCSALSVVIRSIFNTPLPIEANTTIMADVKIWVGDHHTNKFQ